MNRRDLLLNEMQITQWVLRKPHALKGDAQIRLAENIRLVVVCEENYQQSRFFQDCLRALNLNHEQYQWLNLEQSLRLSVTHSPIFWLIEPHSQAVNFVKKFANQTAWQNESWQDLAQSAHKRQLWQQMQPFLSNSE